MLSDKRPSINIHGELVMVNSSNYESIIVDHYNREEVREEIARFSMGRWVALHCETRDAKGRPYLLRYRRARKVKVPLTINEPADVSAHLRRFQKMRPRTFYASANVYREITIPEHIRTMDNIAFCLTTWDIDNLIDKWEATIAGCQGNCQFSER